MQPPARRDEEPASAGPWPAPLWGLLPYPLSAAALAGVAWARLGPGPFASASIGAGVGWSLLGAALLAGAGMAGRLGMAMVLRGADAEDPLRYTAAYGRALHLAAAMRLLCALAGFGAAFALGNPWWSAGLSAAALLALGRGLPRRADYEALVEAGESEAVA